MFSGEKISSRMKRENADSFGSWMTRRGGGAPKGEAPAGGRRAMAVLKVYEGGGRTERVGGCCDLEVGARNASRQNVYSCPGAAGVFGVLTLSAGRPALRH